MKLNVDGQFTRQGLAGCCGLLRGEDGQWLRGFSVKLNKTSPVALEFRAVIEGLKMCWLLGIKSVVVESDARTVIMAINTKQTIIKCRHLLRELQELLTHDWEIKFEHVYREANRCADTMASFSMKQAQERMDWIGPPQSVVNLLETDRNGQGCPRRILA